MASCEEGDSRPEGYRHWGQGFSEQSDDDPKGDSSSRELSRRLGDMYYRRAFYPHQDQADVPDDVWSELQRIRGHLFRIDQNNVSYTGVERANIVKPNDENHYGVSDIVDRDGKFLYRYMGFEANILSKPLHEKADDEQWYNLGTQSKDKDNPLLIPAYSRGGGTWLVGVSVTVQSHLRDGEIPFQAGDTATGRLPGALNVHLRAHCSQDGLSVAESVCVLNRHSSIASFATVASFISTGGQVDFSPALMVSWFGRTEARVYVNKANIWVVGLYR